MKLVVPSRGSMIHSASEPGVGGDSSVRTACSGCRAWMKVTTASSASRSARVTKSFRPLAVTDMSSRRSRFLRRTSPPSRAAAEAVSRNRSRAEGGSGPRVGLAIGLQESLGGDMGVSLRGGEGGMAEQLLDGAQVRPGVEKVGGERMAQRVGRDLPLDGAGQDVPVHDPPHASGVEARSPEIEKQGVLSAPGSRLEVGA